MMKRILTIALTTLFCLTMTFSSFEAKASDPVKPLTTTEFKNLDETEKVQRAELLEDRLQEIAAIDADKLERADKRALRKEVRGIESELNALHNGGIYIGGGAVIIIVLLIILL